MSGVSSASATRGRLSSVMDLSGAHQDVASALFPGQSGVGYCCYTWVSQIIGNAWLVGSLSRVGVPSLLVCYVLVGRGILRTSVQLSSVDDITGGIRVPSGVGELKQIEEPVTSPDILKWIDAPMKCTNNDRGWEGLRLRLSNSFISCSFRRVRGEQRNSVVVSRIIALGLGRTDRQGNSGHEATFAVRTAWSEAASHFKSDTFSFWHRCSTQSRFSLL